MGWFNEQIKERIKHDDEVFRSAMAGMADVIMGEKLSQSMQDDRIRTKNAIEEILKFYRVRPQELPDGIDDFDDQIEYLMRPSGIMRRMVMLNGNWYRDAVGAMIGTRSDDGSTVALIPGKMSGYTFFDAASGKRVKVTKKNVKLIDAEAVCFYKPFPNREIGIKDLIVYMAGCLSFSDILLTAAAALASALAGMLAPKLNNIIYGQVIPDGNFRLLFSVFGFLLCASFSQTMLETVKTLLLSRISSKMNIQVEAAGTIRMLSLPAKFFKDYSSGDLYSRMSYMNALCTIIADTVLTAGFTSVFSLVYITQMVRYGKGMVIPALTVILVTAVFSALTTFIGIKRHHEAMELSAKEAGINYALISGVQKIKLAGAEKRAFAKWASVYSGAAKMIYDLPTYLSVFRVISACIPLAGTIVIYYFTVKTGVSLADYFSFNAAYGCVMGAFSAAAGMAEMFAQAGSMMKMLSPILKTVPEISENKKVVTRLSGAVELNNVSFRYDENMPLIIDDMSLKIKPGQYVAVVGATGCGKSTLMRLMLGFETPQKGAVYYDGKDVSSLDLKSLRKHIGTVMQDGRLFQGDIFSNITVSAPWLTMDDAWEAAAAAGIAGDIKNMPMGMQTIISEGSGGISGGQRQRIMIARAVAPKPKILMFDEATSALDNMTQKTVSDSLDKLKCTRIVIAHRLSTIMRCDRIIMLENGKIAEDGTYDELIAKGGAFAELVKRQRVDEKV